MFIKVIEMTFLSSMNNEWEYKKFQNLKKLFPGHNDTEIIYTYDGYRWMSYYCWLELMVEDCVYVRALRLYTWTNCTSRKSYIKNNWVYKIMIFFNLYLWKVQLSEVHSVFWLFSHFVFWLFFKFYFSWNAGNFKLKQSDW